MIRPPLAGLVWIEDLETVTMGWRTRRPRVGTMGLGCGVLVLYRWDRVLAAGSSWPLRELRRNVSLYILCLMYVWSRHISGVTCQRLWGIRMPLLRHR